MMLRIFQKGFNFNQDGPGNRLVYHLQGCNLHCPWCSNPEGMAMVGGRGATALPNGVWSVEVSELVEECERSRKLFFGGGGVTFTGGEATCQAQALTDALKALRERGIDTALETNGTASELPAIARYVDSLMMDVKHVDAARFESVCGGSFAVLAENFATLARERVSLHVRIPLVNGFNADDAEAFAEYFAAHGTPSVDYEFLKYHEYGKGKWTSPYAVTNGFVTAEQIRTFRQAFSERNLKVVST